MASLADKRRRLVCLEVSIPIRHVDCKQLEIVDTSALTIPAQQLTAAAGLARRLHG
jgi:hypothetical protein